MVVYDRSSSLQESNGIKATSFVVFYNENSKHWTKKLSSLKYQNSEEMYNSMCTESLHIYYVCCGLFEAYLLNWKHNIFLDLNDFSIKKRFDIWKYILLTMFHIKQNVKITKRSILVTDLKFNFSCCSLQSKVFKWKTYLYGPLIIILNLLPTLFC